MNPYQHATFSGHETFTFRYGWLKKGFEGVRQDPAIFTREDATTLLGVGKNMVKSIRHWCVALGVIAESKSGYEPTPWGTQLLTELDAFLEDPASLWLLQWNLVSRPEAPTTWHWVFNELKGQEFTKRQLVQGLTQVCQAYGNGRSSANTIKRDVDCFIRTYVPAPTTRNKILEESLDCPLVELELIQTLDDGEAYRFATKPNSTLSDAALAYCISDYWHRNRQDRETLPLEEVCYAAGSPGRAFRLSESDLLTRIERISSRPQSLLRFTDTAGLKQLTREVDTNQIRETLLKEAFTPSTLMTPHAHQVVAV